MYTMKYNASPGLVIWPNRLARAGTASREEEDAGAKTKKPAICGLF
jgi:hypothetical protein